MSRCLVTGSMVRTQAGETVVEDIRALSEIITTRNGVDAVEPVRWVGRRHLDLKAHARPEQLSPARIRAGAIADSQPSRDLLVSPEHAIFIDGMLIQARALINGGSIVQERAMEAVTYYHIELDSHGLLFANDLAVESYLDNGDRSFFDNHDQSSALLPSLTPAGSYDMRPTSACAPFVIAPAAIEPVWRHLAQRSQSMGYTHAELLTTADANLHVLADGKPIYPTPDGDGRYVFVVPKGVSAASLISHFGIPSDTVPYADDSRRLGFAVTSIVIRSRGKDTVIPADFPGDAPGWHGAERTGSSIWRWTDGTAALPLRTPDAPAIVTITGRALDRYPVYDEYTRLQAA